MIMSCRWYLHGDRYKNHFIWICKIIYPTTRYVQNLHLLIVFKFDVQALLDTDFHFDWSQFHWWTARLWGLEMVIKDWSISDRTGRTVIHSPCAHIFDFLYDKIMLFHRIAAIVSCNRNADKISQPYIQSIVRLHLLIRCTEIEIEFLRSDDETSIGKVERKNLLTTCKSTSPSHRTHLCLSQRTWNS